MSDGLSLSKDKRHRSSSSLAGVLIEGTRSERKLDTRDSIPEVDEHFAIAEARCNELQEKINLVKELKRKRKIKKRSMTRVTDLHDMAVNSPILSVRTLPKKKISQQASRLRRLEVPQNPTRGYLDPAMLEQHQMIGQMRGYNQIYAQPKHEHNKDSDLICHAHSNVPLAVACESGRSVPSNMVELGGAYEHVILVNGCCQPKKLSNPDLRGLSRLQRHRRARADGDSISGRDQQCPVQVGVEDAACGVDIKDSSDSDNEVHREEPMMAPRNVMRTTVDLRKKSPAQRRKLNARGASKWSADNTVERNTLDDRMRSTAATAQWHRPLTSKKNNVPNEERIVVELFNKNRDSASPDGRCHRNQYSSPGDLKSKRGSQGPVMDRDSQKQDDQTAPIDATPPEFKKATHRHPRKVKYRSRRYELPTVASQMKQAGVRYCSYNTNHTNIPFVVSKSTAPSHNIGVNIQQVLNGIKIQQPLSGIPLTIAYHMGLGHVSNYATKSATVQRQPSLEHNRDINAIKVGRRLLRLPSYKYMSYNRLLSLYREGDGMVPRFLRSISRPHYFYTSMYNLATNREDFDGATSKGCAGSQEAKQSLAEYASLYRQYEQLEKCLKEGQREPEWERRREELARELAAREEHIRKVVQDYRSTAEQEPPVLRASASTAEEGYRHSTFRLNRGEQ